MTGHVTFTTDLPDAEGLTLDNSEPNEFVAEWNTVLNNGQYRLESRDDGPDGDHPDYEHEATVAYDAALDHTIGGLLNGEKYSVRLRTETDYATGDWITVSQITDLFAVSGLQLTQVDETVANWQSDIRLSWDIESDFRGEHEVWRREVGSGDELGELVGAVGSDIDEFVDETDTRRPGRDYEYTVRVQTAFTNADASIHLASDIDGLSASFEMTIEGSGDLDDVEPDIKAIQATLRHTATSDVQITTPDLGPGLRDYSDIFADTELRVRLSDVETGETVDTERVFKGVLTHVETHGQADEATLHTTGRGWYLAKDEAIVEFESIQTWRAVEQYLEEETDFEVEVIPDPGSPVVMDELGYQARTQSEWEDLVEEILEDTDPFLVDDGQLHLAQSCFHQDASDGSSGSFITTSADEYSNGTTYGVTSSGETAEWTFPARDHTIPGDEVAVFTKPYGSDEAQAMELILEVDGSEHVLDFLSGGEGIGTTWSDSADSSDTFNGDGYDGDDIEPDDEVVLKIDAVGSTGDEFGFDRVALADGRFSYTLDNTVHEPQGDYDGPEEYPDAATITLAEIERETQVEAARITSTWSDTSNQQALAATNQGEDGEFLSESNTNSLEVNFSESELFGQLLVAELTLSRYPVDQDPQDATPRFGYEGQSVDEFELRFDQTSISVISEPLILSESHLDNIKTLCNRGRLSFAIDHTSDGKRIEVFPRGYVPDDADDVEWMTKDWSREDGSDQYANRVVARGAQKPEDEQEGEDDLRYEAVVEDEDEIDRLLELGAAEEKAIQSMPVNDPEWQSQEEVSQQAFAVLEGFVEERLASGTIDVVPTLITPGYAYPVEEFEKDGEVPNKVLEKVSYSEGYGQDANGELEFEEPMNWVQAVNPIENDVGALKRLF